MFDFRMVASLHLQPGAQPGIGRVTRKDATRGRRAGSDIAGWLCVRGYLETMAVSNIQIIGVHQNTMGNTWVKGRYINNGKFWQCMGEQFISGFLYGSWMRGNLLRLPHHTLPKRTVFQPVGYIQLPTVCLL